MTSIWLRPQGHQEQAIQNLIDRMAEEYRTVSFHPHLTVCGVPATPTCSTPRRLTSGNAGCCR